MTDDLLCATVSVRAVIENTCGEVLTVQRSSDHDWELPGGRLSRGEPPREGLYREIREETGLTVEITEIVKANSWINTAGDGRFAVHYYCETTDDGVTLSDEHVDSEWARPKKAQQRLCDPQSTAVDIATTATDLTTREPTTTNG
ncbi:NUDIX hydrolase [Halorubrum ezzemoulense]|uniref:NUDIX hydrolase n=1 Tax=Halorubrum ezzemoulense TaxID=337243 RepID=UPI00232BA6C4|nr:NUDIX domain-containing protein [Halorubrum ezzemoulense]MDB9235531.1 NUDIX domain-containing protein [Halorubrum ezzemoulense]